MNATILEKYGEAIDILGEDLLEDMYSLLGSEKISFATLRSMNRKRKMLLTKSKNFSVSKIAKEYGVSRMTVYRLLKQYHVE